MDQNGRSLAKSAFRFVLIIGIANFFADLTYESARSINGQYLAALGAASAAVGFTAGFGELVGYGLRSLFGLITDRTGKYWLFTILGYIINLLAVPAMALADNWPVAAVLMESRRGESHPPALAEPDMSLSAHPAPIAQPSGRKPNRQCAKRLGSRRATFATTSIAR